jgi:hypothetical protein
MTENYEKYPVELDDYECDLIIKNAIVFGQLKSTLNRMSKKKGIHTIHMSLREISDLGGWMAAESNHAQSPKTADELGLLCDHFENIEFQIKHNLLAPKH